jgi:hypothetical protein
LGILDIVFLIVLSALYATTRIPIFKKSPNILRELYHYSQRKLLIV